MIPKIIHYCWLSGDQFPEKIEHCIKTWRDIIPDYEFVLWDTHRFPLEQSVWVKEAFKAKKYAFAADYIRLYAIYHYGGIYLDCDVEVIKRFDNLLHLPYFIGKEAKDDRVEVAAFGAEKGMAWVKQCMDYYEGRHFKLPDDMADVKVMPDIVHDVLTPQYTFQSINNLDKFDSQPQVINVFPNDWFCANVYLRPEDERPSYVISERTYCVHHFANSWLRVTRFQRYIGKFHKLIIWIHQKLKL